MELTGLHLQDLSLSDDLFHAGEAPSTEVRNAGEAARSLAIPVETIRISRPKHPADRGVGQLPVGESGVMSRGRAAETFVEGVARRPWASFGACPHEDFRDPGRVHVDPLGWVHVCQGIAVGNLFRTPLTEIWESYADACHLCFRTRKAGRTTLPDVFVPEQMYGVPGTASA